MRARRAKNNGCLYKSEREQMNEGHGDRPDDDKRMSIINNE